MTTFSDFKPNNVSELLKAIRDSLAADFNEWWKKNKSAIGGYIKIVSQSAIETQRSLAQGKIGQDLADIAVHSQKSALRQILRHTELMTLVLLQNVINSIFKLVGWAIYNYTGFNFFPELVDT